MPKKHGSALLRNATWGYARSIHRSDDFASELEPHKIYRNELNKILQGENDPLTKAQTIYNHIKDNYKWNRRVGYYPEQETTQTYWNKKGNLADINMLYISMLRSIDIEAYPVLAATRGLGPPVRPVSGSLNYVFAGVKIQDKTYLVDPANPAALFDRLPLALLNWKGILINEGGGIEWIDLTKPSASSINRVTQVQMDSKHLISGSTMQRNTGYFAISTRSLLTENGISNKEDLVSFEYPGMEVSNVEVTDKSDELINLSFELEIENAVEEIGDKLYIPPLFFAALFENPFQEEFRKYPIDFSFPSQIQNIVSLQIPKEYTVDFLPEPIKILLPDNAGFFTYQIENVNNLIQIQTVYQINKVELSADSFYDIKEFFKLRLDKEKEKVVLRRI